MEFNYLAEKRRMLDSLGRIEDQCVGVECHECPLSRYNNGFNSICCDFEIEHPIEATEIVRKWAEEHPQSCCALLGFCSECENSDTCEECWNTEVEE